MIIFYVIAGPPILTASFYLTLLTSVLLEKKTETIEKTEDNEKTDA